MIFAYEFCHKVSKWFNKNKQTNISWFVYCFLSHFIFCCLVLRAASLNFVDIFFQFIWHLIFEKQIFCQNHFFRFLHNFGSMGLVLYMHFCQCPTMVQNHNTTPRPTKYFVVLFWVSSRIEWMFGLVLVHLSLNASPISFEYSPYVDCSRKLDTSGLCLAVSKQKL